MIIISVITDVAAIIFTFLPSIRTSYFLLMVKDEMEDKNPVSVYSSTFVII
jgi:hypothetical protein